MTELATVEQFIFQKLQADPAISVAVGIRIYNAGSVNNPGYPLIQFMSMAPNDVYGVGYCRMAVRDLYLVEAIGYDCGFEAIDPLADRIDAVLQGQHLALPSGQVMSCLRESPYRRREFDSGVLFYHAGGMYKVLVRPND
jgi:hypothetical protein